LFYGATAIQRIPTRPLYQKRRGFFDVVHHDRLMYKLSKTISDKALLGLIRKYLQSGVMVDGVISQRIEGTPQGSPLSPLLSNKVLDELDKELESRGHKFVRYADDCNIYVRSQEAGESMHGGVRGRGSNPPTYSICAFELLN